MNDARGLQVQREAIQQLLDVVLRISDNIPMSITVHLT